MRFKLSAEPFLSGEGGFYALNLSAAQRNEGNFNVNPYRSERTAFNPIQPPRLD